MLTEIEEYINNNCETYNYDKLLWLNHSTVSS